MGWKQFFFDIKNSFGVNNYTKLCNYSTMYAFSYFMKLLLLFVIITGLLYLPSFSDIPEKAEKEFAKFDNISFEVNAEGNEAANFGPLTVDLSSSNRSLEGRGILITSNKVESKFFPFSKKSSTNYLELKDLINDEEKLGNFVKKVSIFLAPYLLLLLFFYHAVKYFIIIIATATLIIMIVRTFHGDIPAKATYKAGFFASIFMLLELPLQVFIDSWIINTLFPYLIFLIFLLIVLFSFEPERIKVSKKEYDSLKEELNKDLFADTGIGSVDMDKLHNDLKRHSLK